MADSKNLVELSSHNVDYIRSIDAVPGKERGPGTGDMVRCTTMDEA